MGLRVNIKEISKRRLPPHQIQQVNPFEGISNLSQADALNKMYEIGQERGKLMGRQEILQDIATLLKSE
jgi:hypothetical protein